VVVEVLSPSTQHIDLREKVLTYRRVATIEEYVIVSQRQPELILQRRAENWAPRRVSGLKRTATE
jgi:Uma2 family endonuclease